LADVRKLNLDDFKLGIMADEGREVSRDETGVA
jgi:hypothetical protein